MDTAMSIYFRTNSCCFQSMCAQHRLGHSRNDPREAQDSFGVFFMIYRYITMANHRQVIAHDVKTSTNLVQWVDGRQQLVNLGRFLWLFVTLGSEDLSGRQSENILLDNRFFLSKSFTYIMMEMILDFWHVFHMPVVCAAHMDPKWLELGVG